MYKRWSFNYDQIKGDEREDQADHGDAQNKPAPLLNRRVCLNVATRTPD